jgi:hypothetical protein
MRVIASATYLAERPDVVVGILTTKLPKATYKTRARGGSGSCPETTTMG